MYHPYVLFARPVRRYYFGRDEALLITNIIADGLIKYKHMLVVTRHGKKQPFLYVTLEVNALAPPESKTDTHFLCRFLLERGRSRHGNMGDGSEFVALEDFEKQALAYVAEELGVQPMLTSSEARDGD